MDNIICSIFPKVGQNVSDVCVTIEDEEAGQWTGSVTLGPVTETVTQWTIVLGKDFIGSKRDLQLIS